METIRRQATGGGSSTLPPHGDHGPSLPAACLPVSLVALLRWSSLVAVVSTVGKDQCHGQQCERNHSPAVFACSVASPVRRSCSSLQWSMQTRYDIGNPLVFAGTRSSGVSLFPQRLYQCPSGEMKTSMLSFGPSECRNDFQSSRPAAGRIGMLPCGSDTVPPTVPLSAASPPTTAGDPLGVVATASGLARALLSVVSSIALVGAPVGAGLPAL